MLKNHSPETQLISSLLNNRAGNEAAGLGVTPDMFKAYRAEYEWLCKYIKTHRKTPSTQTFIEKFSDFPASEVVETEYYVEEILEKHAKSLLISTMREVTHQLQADDVQSAVITMADFEVPIMRKKMFDALKDHSFLDDYSEPPIKIKTPYKTINFATHGGYAPGEFWIIAARLGQGKSWTLQNFAKEALIDGKKVLYYSLEMPTNQIMARMNVLLGNHLGHKITHSELETRTLPVDQYKTVLDDISTRIPGELFVIDSGSGNITAETVRQQSVGMDLVIIDYIGLMTVPGKSMSVDWQMLGMISNQLKQIALVNEVPIIAAAQINRTGDHGGRKPPDVVNIARADSLGQDADVVITHTLQTTSLMAYSISKNRHGPSKIPFFTKFLPDVGNFEEVTAETAADIRDTEDVDYE
jgi:replicative DNA helicase